MKHTHVILAAVTAASSLSVSSVGAITGQTMVNPFVTVQVSSGVFFFRKRVF